MIDYAKEIAKLQKILKKLDRPPAGPNWVRFIRDDPNRTAKEILKFAKGQPPFTYQPAYRGIKDRIELGIDMQAAIDVATKKGAPAGRRQNRELVEAFFDHDAERNYSSSNPIGFDTEYFRVSRDVLVPVAPLSIIRERGKFVPIFICGWTKNPLLLFQRRLLMTIYDDAFLSLTDYQNSPAEVLFFPKADQADEKNPEDNLRESEVWLRGDYDLLSKEELDDCVENFVLARELARQVLSREIAELEERAGEARNESAARSNSDDDLFPKKD